MIGHSAGGWLSRAALGDGSWDLDVINSNDSQAMKNGVTMQGQPIVSVP